MLKALRGTITFTLSPSNKAMSPTCEIFVRALFDFDPMMSQDCPCKEAGLCFKIGEVLMISCKDDDFWWQAKNMDTELSGLIPRAVPQLYFISLFDSADLSESFFNGPDSKN